ncbi:MAG: MFS transporter [Candidatus Bathyarchaeota archaeon]|nr:MFS transporter [Candidatus Bathyarchaeota archaeon]
MKQIFGFMKGNVLVMTICECVWRTTIDIIWPFLSLYVLFLGGSYEAIGIIMATGNFASLILYPLGGYIADYQGRIKLIGYMTFAYGSTFLIPAFTNSWEWLGVGMFFQSLVTFYFPARQALIADSIPPEQRGIGFAATMVIPSAFGIGAPYIGGWLIERFGMSMAMHGLYLSGFFIASAIAMFRLKYLKETVANPKTLDFTVTGIPDLIVKAYRSVFGVLSDVPKRLYTLSFLVSGMVFFASLSSSFWIVRAQEVIGLGYQDWGKVMLVSGIVSVIMGIPAGIIVDRFSKKMIAGACLLLGSVQCYLFLRCTTFTHVVLLAAFTTLTNTFMNPAFQSLFADMTPRDIRGRVLASIGGGGIWLMRGAYGSGVLGKSMQTLGTFLSGYVYRYNNDLPWIILSGALALFGVLFIILVDEPKVAEI